MEFELFTETRFVFDLFSFYWYSVETDFAHARKTVFLLLELLISKRLFLLMSVFVETSCNFVLFFVKGHAAASLTAKISFSLKKPFCLGLPVCLCPCTNLILIQIGEHDLIPKAFSLVNQSDHFCAAEKKINWADNGNCIVSREPFCHWKLHEQNVIEMIIDNRDQAKQVDANKRFGNL